MGVAGFFAAMRKGLEFGRWRRIFAVIVKLLCSNVAEMTDFQQRIIRLLELIALLAYTAVLWVILLGNPRPGGGYVQVGPTTHLFPLDTNGIPQIYGVSLANPHLRHAVFRVVALLEGNVELGVSKGWIKNPIVKSNVWNASEDINRLGLTPGARAIRERSKMRRSDTANVLIFRARPLMTNSLAITNVMWP